MSDDISPVVLNANQRRHFEVLFGRLEDSLARVESLLTPSVPRHRVLWLDEQDIPDSFRERAMPVLAHLRERIAEFAEMLALRPRKVSRVRAVAATLSAEAIRIEDSLSSQLRGYGHVDVSVVEHLDPALKEMAQMLGALASALEHPHASKK
jgi:hypothetical protein